jgi:quinol monooxygenase YgiN
MNEHDNQARSPLTALVEYQVPSETTSVNEWLDVWQDRGEDVLAGEPETSSYEAAVSDQKPNQVLVFERYTNGRASIDAHIARPAHTTLMETMGERKMTRRRVMSNHFADIDDYGWWSRVLDGTPMRDADVLITLMGTRFSSDEMKERYIEVTGEHAAYCFDAEPDTLIYNGCIAQGDADPGPDSRLEICCLWRRLKTKQQRSSIAMTRATSPCNPGWVKSNVSGRLCARTEAPGEGIFGATRGKQVGSE